MSRVQLDLLHRGGDEDETRDDVHFELTFSTTFAEPQRTQCLAFPTSKLRLESTRRELFLPLLFRATRSTRSKCRKLSSGACRREMGDVDRGASDSRDAECLGPAVFGRARTLGRDFDCMMDRQDGCLVFKSGLGSVERVRASLSSLEDGAGRRPGFPSEGEGEPKMKRLRT